MMIDENNISLIRSNRVSASFGLDSLFTFFLSFKPLCNYFGLTIFKFFVAYEKSVERREVKFSRVFERLINSCVVVCYGYIEDCLKKDGVLEVGKRRLFSRKRRVSGAKTSFFESKDFVFFRKNGIFCP